MLFPRKDYLERGICAVPFFAGLGGPPGWQRNAETGPDSTTWRQNMSLWTELP